MLIVGDSVLKGAFYGFNQAETPHNMGYFLGRELIKDLPESAEILTYATSGRSIIPSAPDFWANDRNWEHVHNPAVEPDAILIGLLNSAGEKYEPIDLLKNSMKEIVKSFLTTYDKNKVFLITPMA